MNILEKINQKESKNRNFDFKVGDTVRVHTKIIEGDSERIQVFAGVVIARKGSGIRETFTVRRVAYGQGMEKVFNINSPRIDKIEVERKGRVRRAKLYYLKGKIGKDTKVKDANIKKLSQTAAESAPEENTETAKA